MSEGWPPTVFDPSVTTWKGVMSLDFDYRPPWCTYNSPWAIHNDPKGRYNLGLDSGNDFGFDMDYDLNNDGNWETCALADGTSASDADIIAYTWKRFLTQWDIAADVTEDSSNCVIRVRIKYRNYNIWSPYGYYGPTGVKSEKNIVLTYFGTETVMFNPDNRPGYPTSLSNPIPNFDVQTCPDGSVSVVEFADNIDDYELFFPVLTNAEMVLYKAFLTAIDGSLQPFLYTTFETNKATPFSGEVQNVWVKWVSHKPLRLPNSEYWSLYIKMRETHTVFEVD